MAADSTADALRVEGEKLAKPKRQSTFLAHLTALSDVENPENPLNYSNYALWALRDAFKETESEADGVVRLATPWSRLLDKRCGS